MALITAAWPTVTGANFVTRAGIEKVSTPPDRMLISAADRKRETVEGQIGPALVLIDASRRAELGQHKIKKCNSYQRGRISAGGRKIPVGDCIFCNRDTQKCPFAL